MLSIFPKPLEFYRYFFNITIKKRSFSMQVMQDTVQERTKVTLKISQGSITFVSAHYQKAILVPFNSIKNGMIFFVLSAFTQALRSLVLLTKYKQSDCYKILNNIGWMWLFMANCTENVTSIDNIARIYQLHIITVLVSHTYFMFNNNLDTQLFSSSFFLFFQKKEYAY